jgi:molecular chaperone GrpE
MNEENGSAEAASRDDDPSEQATPDVPGRVGVDPVASRLDSIEVALVDIARELDAGNERASARERVIDRQHGEIERLRSIERVGSMRPVVIDLCKLRNDLMRQAARLPAELGGDRFASLLESFAETVEDALERCGVMVLPREVGSPFLAGRERVAGVVEADDPELDGTVADVIQDGYIEIDGGKVVFPARVTVYRCSCVSGARSDLTKEGIDG